MRSLVLGLGLFVLTIATAGCGTESPDATDDTEDSIGESSDALKATSFTYRCTNLTEGDDFEDVTYLRVRASKVVYNERKTFTKAAGARTAQHDPDYRPRGKIKYVRYEHEELKPGGGQWTHEWKLEPALVAGGKTMTGGDLGGFAIHGITVNWYHSAKYVCFRE